MATLEQLIYARLAGDSALAAALATVDTGQPAVFVEQAPATASKRWDRPNAQSPRLVFSVSRVSDPVRGADATLMVAVFGPSAALPALVTRARALLDGAFWHPADEPPLASRLRAVDPQPEVATLSGAEDAQTLALDLVALPAAAVNDPDPIGTLYTWSGHRLLDSVGAPLAQVNPESWSADSALPALYLEMRGQQLERRWPGGRFQWSGEVRAHALGSDPTTRATVLRSMAQLLAETPDIRLADGSRLAIDRGIALDLTADPLRQGQLTLPVRFWTSAPPVAVARLQNVVFAGPDMPTTEVPPDA